MMILDHRKIENPQNVVKHMECRVGLIKLKTPQID